MNNPYICFSTSLPALKLTLILLIVFAMLSGCASNRPDRIESQANKQEFKANPKTRAEFAVAMQFIKTADYDKAIRHLNHVVVQAPNNPVPYINLAIAYKKMQNLKLAEENLKAAIKLDPWNPVANNEYALLYRKTGRFSEARQVYENLLDKYPKFTMAHKNLGILCDIYMRDYPCAIKHYESYSGATPDDGAVKIWIADLRNRT